MHRTALLLVLLFPALVAPGEAAAQASDGVPDSVVVEEGSRRGFWFNGGVGYGSASCSDCPEPGGLSGSLAVGGTPSRQILLGVGVDWWSGDEVNLIEVLIALTPQVRLYASPTSNLYGLAGVGGVLGGGGDSAGLAVAGILGAGYDLPLGDWVAISPYVRWVVADEGTNFLAAGLGIFLP